MAARGGVPDLREELGLPEVEDIPWDKVQDPMVVGTNRTNRGRDGCRVPLPWTRGGESYGFSPDGLDEPWLPQRIQRWAMALSWIDAGPDVVTFRREPGSECWINLGADPVPMPQGQVLVASAEAHAGTIPTDVAVWLQIG